MSGYRNDEDDMDNSSNNAATMSKKKLQQQQAHSTSSAHHQGRTGLQWGAHKVSRDVSMFVLPGLVSWLFSLVTIGVGFGVLEMFPSEFELAQQQANAARQHRHVPGGYCDQDRVFNKFMRTLGTVGIAGGCLMLLVLCVSIPYRLMVAPTPALHSHSSSSSSPSSHED